MEITTSRGRVAIYAERVLGIKNCRGFGNKELCCSIGLWSLADINSLAQRKAFLLISEFAFTDAVEKAVKEKSLERKLRRSGKLHNAPFYSSHAWISLRYEVLAERGARCECCGASAKNGAEIHVDHIKPRSKFPEIALDKDNLQVLCRGCNLGKSNKHQHNFK